MISPPFQLLLEGVRARQLQDALFMDKRTLEREIQQANLSFNFFDMKAARIEDQVFCASYNHRFYFILLLFMFFEFELHKNSESNQLRYPYDS